MQDNRAYKNYQKKRKTKKPKEIKDLSVFKNQNGNDKGEHKACTHTLSKCNAKPLCSALRIDTHIQV